MSYKYILEIQTEYSLLGPLASELIHNGPDNQVLVVTDTEKKKYVARASKRENKGVLFEVEVLVYLASVDFSSPRLLKTKSGKYSIRVDNTEIVLFEYMTGWQVEKLEMEHLTTDLIERGAAKLGELHQVTKEMNITVPSRRTIFTEYDRLFTLNPDDLSRFKGYEVFLGQARSLYKQAQEIIHKDHGLYGVIHNDYRIQNLIFNNSDCFIIDFDWACPGPLLKDVGLAIAEWSLFARDTGPSREAITKFIDSYNRTAPRAASYDKSLIFWVCFACLSDACTFFVDVLEGKYSEKNIIDIDQCYMYRKFTFFHKEFNDI